MRNQKNKGFTLVELMVVIAIIGILASIVLLAINPQRILGEARDTKKREELLQVKNALQLYYNDNNRYPAPSEFGTGGTVPLIPAYMRQLPIGYTINYTNTPASEYRAGVELEHPSPDATPGNDSQTNSKCGSIPSPGWDAFDYFICPD